MKVKLKDIVSDFIVPMRDKPTRFDGDVPWCRIEDFQGKYLFDSKSEQRVSEDVINAMRLKVYPVNTLLFSCSATIGVTAITKRPLCTNQTFIGIVPSTKIDVEYLYYYLGLIGYRFKQAASVTTIPYLSRKFFEDLEVLLPIDKTVQFKISKVLSDLDAKIELNNKINAELEAMAKLIYDYWFVQFDFPDENGKPYKSSGGKMVYNEELKREIPEGWEAQLIADCCSIVDCLHSKKPVYYLENETTFLLQLNNILDNGLIDLTEKYHVKAGDYATWTKRIEVQDSDIVITNAGRVAATAQIPEGLVTGIGRNITAIRPKSISPTYLYLAFNGEDMRRQILWNTDTGSFFKSLNVKGIKLLYISRPNNDIEERFERLVLPMRRKREKIQIENEKLAELRDWLLPMLMNGQVTVN